MTSKNCVTGNILNSNNFKDFVDNIISSELNNELSIFLSNQIKDDSNIVGGANNFDDIANGAKKGGKKRKNIQLMGTIKHNPKNIVYVPSINNGNKDLSIVLGSTDPSNVSAYKASLIESIRKEVDKKFADLLKNNKIPIMNAGNILDYIEVIEPTIENGLKKKTTRKMNNEVSFDNEVEIDAGKRKGKGKAKNPKNPKTKEPKTPY